MTPERELREALETIEDLQTDVAMLGHYRIWDAESKQQIHRLQNAFNAAQTFIESHVGDPDMTAQMIINYTAYQDAKAALTESDLMITVIVTVNTEKADECL